jgi:hypothetical protein
VCLGGLETLADTILTGWPGVIGWPGAAQTNSARRSRM